MLYSVLDILVRDSDQLQEPSGTDRLRTALTEEAKQRLSEEVCDTILAHTKATFPPSSALRGAVERLSSHPPALRRRSRDNQGVTGAGLISVLEAKPGPGPDRDNQPSRLASVANWVRSGTTNRWVVGSNLDSNPDRDTENVNRMNMDSCKTVVLAALGRPFSLGMLYDCRSDSLIPALKLWDREALEKEADERPQPNTYEKIKLFKDFAMANKENKSIRFLATAKRDDEKKGATLHLYKDGSLATDNFEPPSKPEMNTGSGKSTLINGMINYILGIDWKDSFRFKLINEDQSKSQAESQTTHVITYKINHQEGFKVPYSLTLVDTPGFGDTKGIESDKLITEQIRSLFTSEKGVIDIDAICFVTQASQLTKEVLNERKQLEVAVDGIQAQIRASLAKLEEIRSTKRQIEKHNADISCNENFEFEVEILKPVQKELTKEGEFITNCQQCSVTCHYPCAIADDKKKSGCAAMKDGKCTVCPGTCTWDIHFNQKYRWDYVIEKQRTTIKEVKEKYEKATEAKISVEQLIEHLEEDVAMLQDVIMSLIDTSSHSIARLKEIALRPDPLSTPEYIDLLIKGEKSEAKEGSGKSTLINGMINYILGIDWKDSFRFKLINEDQSRSQAESQTTHVTTYEINHREGFKVPYSLTLVDTPGFGDTRGIESDKAIREQIRSLFTSAKGVFEIDAICFVTQASQVRLTASQKYVFDSVLSIFGKDVVENICILVTFADGQQPPVLEAINAAKMPCPKTDKDLPVHHKFNNSALFAENKSFSDRADQDSKSSKYPEEKNMDLNKFDAMFWAMGASSMETFFISLGHMTTKSLQLTKEVLNERKQLEAAVEGIQPQVRAGLAKLEQIRSTKQQIEKYNADIAFNENFQFEVEIIKPVQIPTNEGEFLTNCQECNITCHSPCYITDDEQKFECAAMKDEKCTVCPGKCVWTIHFNQKYRWDYVKEKHMKTIQQVKDKYEKATEAKITVEELIGHQAEEVLNLQDEIMSLMDTSSRCIARLKEIALRPNPLSTPEYIELLIEGEKSEGKKGYLARIQSLENMKGNAQIMVKASKREKLTEIEEEYIEDSQKRKEKKGFKSKMCAFFKGDWL
ncbi:unnamed protein product [Gadus morhua 'NCC']